MKINNTPNPFNRRLLWIIAAIVLLAAVLVACNSDDAIPTEPTTVAEAPAAAEPTEAPAVTPTEAPAEVPTEAPTVAPPTAEPTQEPAAPLFGTGYCGNAFYPVIEGRAYHYTTNSTLEGSEAYTTTYSDVTDTSFTLSTDVGDGAVITTSWQCSAAGLLSPEFTRLPGEMGDMQIEFVEATGLSIPPEDMFQVGQSWPLHYVANATMEMEGVGTMEIQQTMTMTNTVTAIEAISVPAGDFPNAVRVETASSIVSVISMGGQAQPGVTLEMPYTSWYVEGVGLVRTEMPDFFGDGANYITELVSYE